MARFGVNDADKYGGQGGGGYFSLKNDKDVARVRFLFNSIEDVEGFAVHEVEVDGKKRYVNCLRDYGQPLDVCPFCAMKKPTQVKYFIPIYNMDEDKIQTWERGKQFGAKISSLCSRYPNMVSHIFEIERNGKTGDTNTTYEIFEVGQDDTTLDSFELQDALGTIILDKTADEMDCYLNAGYFPSDDNQPTASQPIIRRGASANTNNGYSRDGYTRGGSDAPRDIPRRTPTNTNGARRDVY